MIKSNLKRASIISSVVLACNLGYNDWCFSKEIIVGVESENSKKINNENDTKSALYKVIKKNGIKSKSKKQFINSPLNNLMMINPTIVDDPVSDIPTLPSILESISIPLSNIIITHTKSELIVFFFNQMKDDQNLRKFFYNSFNVLNYLNPTEYSSSIQTLREAFNKDLNELPFKISEYLSGEETKLLNEDNKVLFMELQKAIKSLINNEELIKVLIEIDTSKIKDENLEIYFKISKEILKSLIDEENKIYKIDVDDLGKILDKDEFFNAYFDILKQNIPQINGNDKTKIRKILGKIKNSISKINLLSLENKINYNDKDLLKYYRSYGNNLSEIVNAVTEVTDLDGLNLRKDFINNIKKYKEIILSFTDMSFDTLGKNYNSAFLNFVVAFNLMSDIKIINKEDFKIRELLKYINFMADVAKAKTPEETEKAIENAVLPAGSSILKKDSYFNIEIGSYLGLITGFKSDYSLNPFMPVGVNTSIPLGSSGKFLFFCPEKSPNNASLSIFASPIDLGSIVNFNTTVSSEKVKIENIFSPSISLVLGTPFTLPLSIGLGYQYKLSNNSNNFILNLSVDVPLIELYRVN